MFAFQGGYAGFLLSPNYLIQDGSGNLYVGYRAEVYNPYGPEHAAEIGKAAYSNGNWTFTNLAEIRTHEYDSYAAVTDLASDAPGNVYGSVYAECIGCIPQFMFNRLFEISSTGGLTFSAEMGKNFGISGMAVDSHSNVYGATTCVNKDWFDPGAIWQLKH